MTYQKDANGKDLLCTLCKGVFTSLMYVEYLAGKPYHYFCASIVVHQR